LKNYKIFFILIKWEQHNLLKNLLKPEDDLDPHHQRKPDEHLNLDLNPDLNPDLNLDLNLDLNPPNEDKRILPWLPNKYKQMIIFYFQNRK